MTVNPDSLPFYLRKRYLLVFLSFFGYANMSAMLVNFSVGIVAMTENRTIIDEYGCENFEQTFNWNSKEKGLALGAYFYGFVFSQILGGTLASKLGGHLIFNFGVFGCAVFTMLSPLMAYQGIYHIIGARVAVGIFSGLSYPAINDVYSRWIPPLERTRSVSYGITGFEVGTVITNIISGWLGEFFGWQWIFYTFGIAALLWNIAWFFTVYSSPENDPWISQNEKDLIFESLKSEKTQIESKIIPWKEILTSGPVYAIAVAEFCYIWGYFTLLTQLPMYMDEILNYDLASSGVFSALPYFVYLFIMAIAGYLADWFLIKEILSVTKVRKYFNNFALISSMIFLMSAAFSTSATFNIILITLSVGFGSFAMCGYFANSLDIAPQYSSIIRGITATFGCIPGMMSPLLTGYIVTTPSAGEYRIVFMITCLIYLFGAIFYGIFASGNIQSWAVTEYERVNLNANESNTQFYKRSKTSLES